ncbi:DUF4363 family protein [Lutibacter sp. B2]|nr:DUF4363 family protein [Lutibacter sp. B2]
MKVIIISTLSFLIMLSGCFYIYQDIEYIVADSTQALENLTEKVQTKQWPSALKQLEKLHKDWKSHIKICTFFADQNQLYDIEFSIIRIQHYIKNKNISMSIQEIHILMKIINILQEQQKPSIQNIF